jgi:hypothetical protein
VRSREVRVRVPVPELVASIEPEVVSKEADVVVKRNRMCIIVDSGVSPSV